MVSKEVLRKVKTCSTEQAQYLCLKVFDKSFAALVVAIKQDGILRCLPDRFDVEQASTDYEDIFLGYINML